MEWSGHAIDVGEVVKRRKRSREGIVMNQARGEHRRSEEINKKQHEDKVTKR